ncbi:mitochondrial import inner membrane translocase subunit Tim10 B [Pholidichthys leucotaenia]
MDPDQQLRNLRDFLLVYNRMTEICFQRCTSNFNYRNLTMDEDRCVDNCAGKLIRSNHRLMGTYVQLMPSMVQRRMDEMESKAAESAKAASGAAGTANAEASPALPSAVISSPTTQVSPLPAELDSVVSKSATSIEVKLSAAAPLTPAAETATHSGVNNGPLKVAPLLSPPQQSSLSKDALGFTKLGSIAGQETASQVPPVSDQ